MNGLFNLVIRGIESYTVVDLPEVLRLHKRYLWHRQDALNRTQFVFLKDWKVLSCGLTYGSFYFVIMKRSMTSAAPSVSPTWAPDGVHMELQMGLHMDSLRFQFGIVKFGLAVDSLSAHSHPDMYIYVYMYIH